MFLHNKRGSLALSIMSIKDLPTDFRISVLEAITDEIASVSFCSLSRNSLTVARKRLLPTINLLLMIISFKTSIQRELDSFFKAVSKGDFNIRIVTKGAFTQARAKLNPWAFKRLNEVVVASFYKTAPYTKWHGRRVLSVDGTRFLLPNHPTVKEKYGLYGLGAKADTFRSMSIGSMLYDTLNQVVIDAQMGLYTGSETDLLLEHIPHINLGDILLLDRGYPSFWLLHLLHSKNIDFCVRLKKDWVKVKQFLASGDTDCMITLKLPKSSYSKLNNYAVDKENPINCRLIKVVLENGEIEVLCTTLIDEKEFDQDVFKELYHFRWTEEEAYKLLKSRIELENFSGKTVLAVEQDFYAKTFLMTLTAALAHPIAEKVKEEYKKDEKRMHDQQINRTNAIATTSSILIPAILKNMTTKAIKAFDKIVFCTREIVRTQRSVPRKHIKVKPFNMNYKPL